MFKKFTCVIIFVLLLCSCSNTEKFENKFEEGYGYTSEVKMIVYGNKINSEYVVKQSVNNVHDFKIEAMDPVYLKGEVIIQANAKWKISHPGIKQEFSVSNILEINNYIVLGIIDSNLFSKKDITMKKLLYNGEMCNVFDYYIGLNMYKTNALLYLNKENIPVKLEIVDMNGVKKIQFLYNNFKFIKNFESGVFNIF